MAEKKEASVENVETVDDRVTIMLPRALPGEEETLFVGVNGKGYRIKKGVSVSVPRAVAEVLQSAELAREKAYQYQNTL